MESQIKDAKTAKALLKQGQWCSTPNDVMTIVQSMGICNTIEVRVTNEPNDVDYTISVSNLDGAWQWLKHIDSINGRTVKYQPLDGETIDFKDSTPYKHRFSK